MLKRITCGVLMKKLFLYILLPAVVCTFSACSIEKMEEEKKRDLAYTVIEQDEMPQMAISNPRQGDGQIYMKTNRAGKRSALNHQPVKAGGTVLPDSPIHTQKDPAADQQSGTHGWNS